MIFPSLHLISRARLEHAVFLNSLDKPTWEGTTLFGMRILFARVHR